MTAAVTLNVGDVFTREFTVDARMHAAFTDVFNDRNELHVDDDYARRHGFKEKVMHGNILGGFVSYFVGEGLPVRNTIIMTQEMKFREAVYMNDTLQFSAKIAEVYESVSAYVIKFTFSKAQKVVASGSVQIGLIS